MTITIELTSDEEALLREQAGRQGRDPQSVARALVRNGLKPTPGQITDETQERLGKRLLEIGLLTELPTRRLGPPPPPIVVQGSPVSETILEERR